MNDCAYFQRVRVTFTHFALEPKQEGRAFDWLDIYDGQTPGAPKIGRYSGDDKIPIVKSTGKFMYIVFHSDDSVTANGFRFTYSLLAIKRKGEQKLSKANFMRERAMSVSLLCPIPFHVT